MPFLEGRLPKIFISYRREDSHSAAAHIADRLRREFGRDSVFIDVDAIGLGVDFPKLLSKKVGRSDVMIAVIGPNWVDIRDDAGARRLENPKDFVRIEIRAALERDIRVIPVLLDGAGIPGADRLPGDIAPLSDRHGLYVRHNSFDRDVGELIRALKPAPRARLTALALWIAGSLLGFIATFAFLAGVQTDSRASDLVLGIVVSLIVAAILLWIGSVRRRRFPLLVGALAMALSCSLSSSIQGFTENMFFETLLVLHPILTALLTAVFTYLRRWRLWRRWV
jgi:hypothetical protein